MYDSVNDVKIVAAIVAATVGTAAADATGVTIDRSGYEALAFDFNIGIEGDVPSGSVKFDFFVEHSHDANGDGTPDSWVAVEAGDVVLPEWATNMAFLAGGIVLTIDSAAEAPSVGSVGYVGGRKFVRCNVNATGTTNGTRMAVNARLSKPHFAPISP